MFFALADPTRRKILVLLSISGLSQKAITSNFKTTRTAISKHMTILMDARLVKSNKIGRETIYELSPEPLTIVREWLAQYEETETSAESDFIINQEQERFLHYFLDCIQVDKRNEAKALMLAGFQKQAAGTFDKMEMKQSVPQYMALVRPECIEEMDEIMRGFAKNLK